MVDETQESLTKSEQSLYAMKLAVERMASTQEEIANKLEKQNWNLGSIAQSLKKIAENSIKIIK